MIRSTPTTMMKGGKMHSCVDNSIVNIKLYSILYFVFCILYFVFVYNVFCPCCILYSILVLKLYLSILDTNSYALDLLYYILVRV